jgi:hypothetical protein
MFEFLFGKKVAKKSVKYPKGLLKMAKKYKVKLTVKRGSKRVRKSVKTLKKDIKMRMRKVRQVRHRFGFGSHAGVFDTEANYGYSQDVRQVPGITDYTNVVVQSAKKNADRPINQPDGVNSLTPDGKVKLASSRLPASTKLPVYGVGKTFFNQTVPGNMSPRWYAMAQPKSAGGGLLQVGWPFSAYKAEAAFGKKRKVSKRKSVKKPSAKLLKLAKKLKIKVTVKRGSKRVYKSVKLLNKQIKKALKKSH